MSLEKAREATARRRMKRSVMLATRKDRSSAASATSAR
jgi:hypothetical protein